MEPVENITKFNRIYIIIIILLLGVTSAGYYFYVEYYKIEKVERHTEIIEIASSTKVVQSEEVNKEIKRISVDIEKENWPVSNLNWSEDKRKIFWEVGQRANPPRFVYDDLYVNNGTFPSIFKKGEDSKLLITIPNDSSGCYRPIDITVYPNSLTGYVYLNCDINEYGLGGLFKVSLSEKIVSSSTIKHIDNIAGATRFSKDKTYLIIKEWNGSNITIFDLLNNDKKYEITIPGDINKFYKERNIDSIHKGLYSNYLGSFNFNDENNIEFSRYWTKLTDGTMPISGGYTQISDKEIWSYNFDTKEYKLLKTIPLDPNNTES